jgi:fibulin 1/2
MLTLSDIDECSQADKGGCDQVCTNTNGSYNCSCNSGFTLNKYGQKCDSKILFIHLFI